MQVAATERLTAHPGAAIESGSAVEYPWPFLPLTPGTRFGAFEILSPLGEGGMGEVYRARDTRLDRHVALKVLLDAWSADADRMSRFEREAKVLASLNHPHIAQLYGIEDSGATKGLVMELVDGVTLADRIASGPVPLDEALPIARQMADALESAHAQGIVHRDLKPANVKVRGDGTVKVLDFGLAKLSDASGPSSSAGMSLLPTVASPVMTQTGVIVGTVAYMSPEQARGKAVDERTDIWAFGCVLFEMLTGSRPFDAGDSTSDAIAAILTREPAWDALPSGTPPGLRRLLRRCLQKDYARRLRDAGDARLEIDEAIAGDPAEPAPSKATPRPASAVAPWAIALAAALLAGVAAWFARPPAPAAPVTRLEMNLPPGVELFHSTSRTVGASPDGRSVAFVGVASGNRRIFLRRLDQFDVSAVRGTDGATTAFFSPDGQSLGFITSAGELRTTALAEGVVNTAARGASVLYGATWSSAEQLVYVHDGALWRVSPSGAGPSALTVLRDDEVIHAFPTPLADHGALLFAVQSKGGRWHIEAVRLDTGERRPVLADATMPLLGPDNRLLFYRQDRLMASAFDPAALTATGVPVPVLEDSADLSAGTTAADASTTGTIVYAPRAATRRLVWVSRHGLEEPVIDVARSYLNPRLSPDGSRIVLQAGQVWVLDIRRKVFERVTAESLAANAYPTWLADSRRVIHRSGLGLRIESIDGASPGRTLPGTTEFDYPGAVSADGRTLLILRNSAATSFDLLTVPLDNPAGVTPFVQTAAYEGGARLSADGKWVTYVSDESGRNEIYVRAFPDGGRRWQVSVEGGTQPAWNGNSREIFYRTGDRMMSVNLRATAAGAELSTPLQLFERAYSYGGGITISNYDVTADGQRFLMVKDEPSAAGLRIILNWSPDVTR